MLPQIEPLHIVCVCMGGGLFKSLAAKISN